MFSLTKDELEIHNKLKFNNVGEIKASGGNGSNMKFNIGDKVRFKNGLDSWEVAHVFNSQCCSITRNNTIIAISFNDIELVEPAMQKIQEPLKYEGTCYWFEVKEGNFVFALPLGLEDNLETHKFIGKRTKIKIEEII